MNGHNSDALDLIVNAFRSMGLSAEEASSALSRASASAHLFACDSPSIAAIKIKEAMRGCVLFFHGSRRHHINRSYDVYRSEPEYNTCEIKSFDIKEFGYHSTPTSDKPIAYVSFICEAVGSIPSSTRNLELAMEGRVLEAVRSKCDFSLTKMKSVDQYNVVVLEGDILVSLDTYTEEKEVEVKKTIKDSPTRKSRRLEI